MKQILLINDVVGHSHVGMVAMMPILTYLGHAVYNLPTALVSNTLDYGHFNVMETTEYMRGTLPVWKKLGFRFDAVCTGLMFSEEQAKLVGDYCRRLAAEGTTVFVDPIMGDGGHLYNGMSQRQVELMREMVSVADLTFPNYTEACYLTDIPFRKEGMDWEDACRMLDAIVALGARSALNTGEVFALYVLPAYHGTGDIFSAVAIGHLMNGDNLKQSTMASMNVVSSLIERNREQEDACLGIPIEKCLDLL